ncbi:MAG: glycosyltransferase family 8 protein [Methylacidiphilales bacterium]|nr:glycosyltransferase family 8 protein [Candidatus Methylacidiphilales bacterium]
MIPPSVKPPVNVVCAANAGFNMPLCVMLTSLVVRFDPDRQLIIHVLSLDSGEKEKKNLRLSLLQNRPDLKNVEIHWPVLEPAWFQNLPANNRFGLDTYSRLFAPNVLPPECGKFIYLDCDVIVLTDVAVLYDQAQAPTLLHAVRDVGSPWVSCPDGISNYAELGIPATTWMFNSGLLVIDAKRWREGDITAKVIDYIRRNAGSSFFDQAALNACAYRNWTELDTRWNQCHDALLFEKWKVAGFTRAQWAASRDDPFIIHYTGLTKPWQGKDWKPRYARFFVYFNRTVYRGTLPEKLRLENVIGFRNYLYFWLFLRFGYHQVRKLRELFAGASL